MELVSLHAIVKGLVQGVLFRNFVLDHANALGISGYVRNRHTGNEVEVYAEGEREKLERLLEQMRIGPPGARVDKVEVYWADFVRNIRGFNIRY